MVTDGETIIYRNGRPHSARVYRAQPSAGPGRSNSRFWMEERIRELEDRVAELERRLSELAERPGPGAEPDLPTAAGWGQGGPRSGVKVSLFAAQGATAVVGPARIHMDDG